jgi:hypothetical protein
VDEASVTHAVIANSGFGDYFWKRSVQNVFLILLGYLFKKYFTFSDLIPNKHRGDSK